MSEEVTELPSSGSPLDLGDMEMSFPALAHDAAVSASMVMVVRAIAGDGLDGIGEALSCGLPFEIGFWGAITLSGFSYFPSQLLSLPHQLLFPPPQCGQHTFFLRAM